MFLASVAAPNDKMKEVLKKTVAEAKDMISKVFIISFAYCLTDELFNKKA